MFFYEEPFAGALGNIYMYIYILKTVYIYYICIIIYVPVCVQCVCIHMLHVTLLALAKTEALYVEVINMVLRSSDDI